MAGKAIVVVSSIADSALEAELRVARGRGRS